MAEYTPQGGMGFASIINQLMPMLMMFIFMKLMFSLLEKL